MSMWQVVAVAIVTLISFIILGRWWWIVPAAFILIVLLRIGADIFWNGRDKDWW